MEDKCQKTTARNIVLKLLKTKDEVLKDAREKNKNKKYPMSKRAKFLNIAKGDVQMENKHMK